MNRLKPKDDVVEGIGDLSAMRVIMAAALMLAISGCGSWEANVQRDHVLQECRANLGELDSTIEVYRTLRDQIGRVPDARLAALEKKARVLRKSVMGTCHAHELDGDDPSERAIFDESMRLRRELDTLEIMPYKKRTPRDGN